ncbi:MAG TPA: hypothetical protein VM243_12335 [Phycisphaerae bacterium]|nr:hypothetical protein [Phycisphaerae bacterium]
MNPPAERAAAAPGLRLLIGLKLSVLRNLLRQAVDEAPLKVAVSVGFVALIWLGLYTLFVEIFYSLQTSLLERAVVMPVMFNIFFLALLILLTLSNAVIAYGSLFSGREPGFLLATPVPPIHLVTVKYLESLFFASWALILLGLPLMLAVANSEEEPASFYPLFLAFFLFFVPIPGALGMLLAYVAARFAPRGSRGVLLAVGVLVLAAAALWSLQLVHIGETTPRYAKVFFERMEFVEAALLPSTWVARGIERALHSDHSRALGYLTVTLANAVFASWLAVTLSARGFSRAYDRATTGSSRTRNAEPANRSNAEGLCERIFFYLPARLRFLAAKDLRTFLRDPLQWSQLAILFGLMALYLLNLPRFYTDLLETSWGTLVPFLNLCAVTLILATFTSRFVFPLVSLEGHQLWLIGLLPLPRRRILIAKFAYAFTITAIVSVTVIVLAAVSLHMHPGWALLNVVVILGVCVGLCGLAVGLGARLPMFGQLNPGRIANGFGGTINLIASVTLVVGVLTGMAVVAAHARGTGPTRPPDPTSVAAVLAIAALPLAVGLGALRLGGRHFEQLEV